MNYYEMMVIFSPNLTDEEIRTQAGQVEDLIAQQKGTLHLVDHWGKRKLAYSVKKQRQGFYVWYYFELDPARVAEIDRKLKMSETLLRFMIVKMEKIQTGNLHREKERRAQIAQAPMPETIAVTAPAAVAPEEAPAESPAAIQESSVEAPAAETEEAAAPTTTAAGEPGAEG